MYFLQTLNKVCVSTVPNIKYAVMPQSFSKWGKVYAVSFNPGSLVNCLNLTEVLRPHSQDSAFLK